MIANTAERGAAHGWDGAASSVPPEAISLQLLGGFHLRCGIRDLSLPLGVQRLVAFLALHDGRRERRYVAARLWFGGSDRQAAANLRSALWRLRRECSAPVVESNRVHLQIARTVRVDIREHVKRVRELMHGGTDLPAVGRVLDEEELLPGWYDDWVAVDRERLHQLRLHTMEVAAERLASRGRYGEAVDVALAAVAADPLRESARRALVRAYLAEQNPCEALRQYDAYEKLLQSRLGLKPSSELAELIAPFRRRLRVDTSGDDALTER